MWRATLQTELPAEEGSRTLQHSATGKRERSGAGLGSPVSGSNNQTRTQTSDGNQMEGVWTTVRRRRRPGQRRQQDSQVNYSVESRPGVGPSTRPPVMTQPETRPMELPRLQTDQANQPAGHGRNGPHLSRRQRRKRKRDLARREADRQSAPARVQPPQAPPRQEGASHAPRDKPVLQMPDGGYRPEGQREPARWSGPTQQTPRSDLIATQPSMVSQSHRWPAQTPSSSEQAGQAGPPTPQQVTHDVQAAGHGSQTVHGPARVATHSYGYSSSLFVPGRVGGRNLTFLIDTGCTHNLLSRSVFDRLPAPIKERMRVQESTAAMADGSGLPIYGSIRLEGRIRNVKFEADFLVCRISDDGIIGMSFLREQDCSVACDKGLLVIKGTAIQCTDKTGRLLANKVQVVRTLVLPPEAETQVCCRLNSDPSQPIGLIESLLDQDKGVAVAATLGKPTTDGTVLVRCLNLTREPQQLRAGSIIRVCQPIEEEQVESPLSKHNQY